MREGRERERVEKKRRENEREEEGGGVLTLTHSLSLSLQQNSTPNTVKIVLESLSILSEVSLSFSLSSLSYSSSLSFSLSLTSLPSQEWKGVKPNLYVTLRHRLTDFQKEAKSAVHSGTLSPSLSFSSSFIIKKGWPFGCV